MIGMRKFLRVTSLGSTSEETQTWPSMEEVAIWIELDGVAGSGGCFAVLEEGGVETVEAAVDMGEDVIEMDSVKRKRKKKISKHKYKKRRKATRAERKKLGK